MSKKRLAGFALELGDRVIVKETRQGLLLFGEVTHRTFVFHYHENGAGAEYEVMCGQGVRFRFTDLEVKGKATPRMIAAARDLTRP